MKYIIVILVPFLIISCKNSEKFTGFSYDPPDVTNTTDKETEPQKRRVIGVGSPAVWISNEFSGARLNDFYMAEDSVLEVFIKPENSPINNSPWYAFKIWSDTTQSLKIRLNYEEATHRYIPKINQKKNGRWEVTEDAEFTVDDSTGMATLQLNVGKDPVLITAQPLYTLDVIEEELALGNITTRQFVEKRKAGTSTEGRPVWELEINETEDGELSPVLVILSRQHPPEVSGFRASLIFLEELTSESELARRFRDTFVVMAYPVLNPDGVQNGHWRHNASGVDLNRDWEHFNQPETRAVRDALLKVENSPNRQIYYGIDFHSTNENIFYPILEEVKTEPDNFTQQWTEKIKEMNPDVVFTTEEFDTSSPISKNWIYKTFGADAVTYEIHDEMDDETIEEVSRSAARLLMEMLLDAWHKKKS